MDTYVARTPTIRTSRILVGFIVVAVVGALALGFALATRTISLDPLTTSSRDAVVQVHSGVGPGYPPHNGFAGPSSVIRGNTPMGPDYPPHHGLAGPSSVVRGEYPMGGAPAHGGLAGPSGVESSH